MLSGISSLFVVIRLHDVVPLAGMGFFVTKITILMIMNVNVFGFGGKIFEGSNEVLETWKQLDKLEIHKWFKRAMKSNYSLKIKYSGAYIDKLTPLVLNGFLIEQTITLVLLAP